MHTPRTPRSSQSRRRSCPLPLLSLVSRCTTQHPIAVGLLGVGDALAHRDPLRDRRRALQRGGVDLAELAVEQRDDSHSRASRRRARRATSTRSARSAAAARRPSAWRTASMIRSSRVSPTTSAARAACPPPPRCGARRRGRRAAPAPSAAAVLFAGRVDAHLDLLGRRRGRLPRSNLIAAIRGRRTRASPGCGRRRAGCRAPTRTGAPAGCVRSGRTGRRPSRSRARRRGCRPTTSSPARRRGRARGTTSQSGRA